MRLRRALLSLVAAGLLVAPVAIGQVPLPGDDPFYAVPSGISGLSNGTILGSRPIAATLLSVPLPAQAWQVKYKTLDEQGNPTATVTTVIVPNTPWSGRGPRPFLSYQTFEDGVGTQCAPSYALRGGLQAALHNAQSDAEVLAMTLALLRGWTVVVPDYEGLRSQFFGENAESRGVLDGIRAARAFKPAGIAADAPYGMTGYSGGALATAWAAQLQPTYAPELKISGIALGGVVADIKAVIQAFSGGFEGGGVVTGLVGLERSHPELDVLPYLNALGRQYLAASQSDCVYDDVLKYPFLSISQIESRPDVLEEPAFTKLLARISPLSFGRTPTEPVYDYHATGDELAPVGPDRQLMARYCAASVPVDHVEQPVGEHITALPLGFTGALDYLSDRFAGKPAPNNCPRHTTTAQPPTKPKSPVLFSLRVRPGTVRHGRHTRFAFLARERVNGRWNPLPSANICLEHRCTRTNRTGRATITATLPRTPRRQPARLIVRRHTIAQTSISVR